MNVEVEPLPLVPVTWIDPDLLLWVSECLAQGL